MSVCRPEPCAHCCEDRVIQILHLRSCAVAKSPITLAQRGRMLSAEMLQGYTLF